MQKRLIISLVVPILNVTVPLVQVLFILNYYLKDILYVFVMLFKINDLLLDWYS